MAQPLGFTGGLSHPLSYWLANDLVLENGQKGLIEDLGWHKIGDGINAFSGLPVRGLNDINVWFSNWGPEQNKGDALCSIYHNTLIGGTLVQQGGWIEFNFELQVLNNTNSKNVLIKFSNQTLANIAIPITGAYKIPISGKIKLIDYTGQKAFYQVVMGNPDATYRIFSGTLLNINFAANNTLILQTQGAQSGDIIANGGDGKICVIARF